MIPEICGLILTSLRGSILPVMMVVFWMFSVVGVLPEEHECSDENQRDNGGDNQFAVLFHILVVFYCYHFGGVSDKIADHTIIHHAWRRRA